MAKQALLQQYTQKLGTVANLDTAIDLEKALALGENVDQHYNVPFAIMDIEERVGDKGRYLIIYAHNLLTEQEVKLQTGGVVIVSILDKVKEANKFPVACAFYPKANSDVKMIRAVTQEDFS